MSTYSEVTPDVIGIASEVISHYHRDLIDAKMRGHDIMEALQARKMGALVSIKPEMAEMAEAA